jgi:tetratricopeptide (TPR) repeat protein
MGVDRKRTPQAPGKRDPRRWARGNTVAEARRMVGIERWHTARRWAVVAFWLVCSVTDVSAQDGRWDRITAAGVNAFEQGDYAEAALQFQVALPLADAGRLPLSLMNLAAVYYAQGQYTDAAPLYQRALVLQEQILGPDHPQLISVLEANAALHRKMHPVRSLLPWSLANRMADRARRIREREERATLQDFPWGPGSLRQPLGDESVGE